MCDQVRKVRFRTRDKLEAAPEICLNMGSFAETWGRLRKGAKSYAKRFFGFLGRAHG